MAITSEAAWNGLQRAEIRVRGAFSPGALQLEVMRGAYVSSAKAALVCTTAEEALEVRSLEATLNPGDADTLVYELGSLVEAAAMAAARRGSPAAAAQALAAAPAPPGKAARRLLPFLVQRKWPLMMRKALDAAIADMPVGEAMGEADVVAAGTTGMPLLQLAVRAQCAEVLSMLLQWARANRHEFKSTTPGRRGLTALHLAALVQDGGLTASLLTAACPDALHGWDGARAEDGSTPLALATRFGTRNTIERIIAEAQYAKLGSFGVVATKSFAEQPMREGPSSSDAVSGKKGITLHRFPSEYDDMALSKAATKSAALATEAAMGPLLTFASPKLEAKFKQWHNAGQVPVDLAFMLIAILSQAAWVARWSMSESLVLGMSMVALMSFNCVYMALATLRPKAYVARREGLCVASLLVHKVVQMLVTVMPGVGTIYSPTYNTTVALLESSSFAQVAMLSFGAKARLVTHVPTLLVLLGLSSLSNGAICSAAWPSLAVGLCTPALFAFQASACWALPCAAVYLAEKRSRRIFLETAVA